MQNKEHPFVLALNKIAPLVVPSFKITSARDDIKSDSYPMLGYTIINHINETYDSSTGMFSGTMQIQIDLLLQEPKDQHAFITCWQKFDELRYNQDKQALMYDMQQKIKQILLLIVYPNKAISGDIRINRNDTLFNQYRFKNLRITTTNSHNRVRGNLTGASSLVSIDFVSERINCCLVNTESKTELELMKEVFQEGSISYNNIQLAIDKLP